MHASVESVSGAGASRNAQVGRGVRLSRGAAQRRPLDGGSQRRVGRPTHAKETNAAARTRNKTPVSSYSMGSAEVDLIIEYAYGYSIPDPHGSMAALSETEVLYSTAACFVLLDLTSNTQKVIPQPEQIEALACSPPGALRLIATACHNRGISVWKVPERGQDAHPPGEVAHFSVSSGSIQHLAFSARGTWLLGCSQSQRNQDESKGHSGIRGRNQSKTGLVVQWHCWSLDGSDETPVSNGTLEGNPAHICCHEREDLVLMVLQRKLGLAEIKKNGGLKRKAACVLPGTPTLTCGCWLPASSLEPTVVTVGLDGMVGFFHSDGHLISRANLQGAESPLCFVCAAPGTTDRVVLGSAEGHLHFVEVLTGMEYRKPLQVYDLAGRPLQTHTAVSVGSSLLVGTDTNTLALVLLPSGCEGDPLPDPQIFMVHNCPYNDIRALAAHPVLTSWVCLGSGKGLLQFCDVQSCEMLQLNPYVCFAGVRCLEWCPDGHILAVGGSSGLVELVLTQAIDTENVPWPSRLYADQIGFVDESDVDPPDVTAVRWSSSGHLLAALQGDTVNLFNVCKEFATDYSVIDSCLEPSHRITSLSTPIFSLQFSSDDLYISAVCDGDRLRTWDVSNGQEVSSELIGESFPSLVTISRRFLVWPPAQGGNKRQLGSQVCLCAAVPGLPLVAVGDGHGHIWLTQFPVVQEAATAIASSKEKLAHDSPVSCLLWTLDGRLLSAGSQGLLQWRLSTVPPLGRQKPTWICAVSDVATGSTTSPRIITPIAGAVAGPDEAVSTDDLVHSQPSFESQKMGIAPKPIRLSEPLATQSDPEQEFLKDLKQKVRDLGASTKNSGHPNPGFVCDVPRGLSPGIGDHPANDQTRAYERSSTPPGGGHLLRGQTRVCERSSSPPGQMPLQIHMGQLWHTFSGAMPRPGPLSPHPLPIGNSNPVPKFMRCPSPLQMQASGAVSRATLPNLRAGNRSVSPQPAVARSAYNVSPNMQVPIRGTPPAPVPPAVKGAEAVLETIAFLAGFDRNKSPDRLRTTVLQRADDVLQTQGDAEYLTAQRVRQVLSRSCSPDTSQANSSVLRQAERGSRGLPAPMENMNPACPRNRSPSPSDLQIPLHLYGNFGLPGPPVVGPVRKSMPPRLTNSSVERRQIMQAPQSSPQVRHMPASSVSSTAVTRQSAGNLRQNPRQAPVPITVKSSPNLIGEGRPLVRLQWCFPKLESGNEVDSQAVISLASPYAPPAQTQVLYGTQGEERFELMPCTGVLRSTRGLLLWLSWQGPPSPWDYTAACTGLLLQLLKPPPLTGAIRIDANVLECCAAETGDDGMSGFVLYEGEGLLRPCDKYVRVQLPSDFDSLAKVWLSEAVGSPEESDVSQVPI